MKEHWRSILLYGISGVALLLLVYMAVDTSLWIDESYTMGIVRYSIPEIISITAKDVHPPLYYIIVKTIFMCTGIEDIYLGVVVARIVSLVPFAIMWILSITCIRRFFGELTGALFSLCLVTAPHMIDTGLEIRMYSWSMLFLLLIYLMIDRLATINCEKTSAYIVLGMSVLCAFYTHYFAAVAAAAMLGVFFLYLIFCDRKQLGLFLFMCVMDAILYLPWLFVAYKQIKTISSGYWIAKIDKAAKERFFWYVYRLDDSLVGVVASFIFVAVSILCIYIVIKNRKDKKYWMALGAMASMLLTTLGGVLASRVFRPVFVERYMLPTFACFWLGYAFLISKIGKKLYLYTGIAIVFIILTIIQYSANIVDVCENRKEMKDAQELFDTMQDDDIIIHSNLHTQIPVAYYCQNSEQYLTYEASTLKIDQIVFDNIRDMSYVEDIREYVEDGKRVWCFVYPGVTFLTEEWQQIVAKGEYKGDYFLDWCQFKVYMWN